MRPVGYGEKENREGLKRHELNERILLQGRTSHGFLIMSFLVSLPRITALIFSCGRSLPS